MDASSGRQVSLLFSLRLFLYVFLLFFCFSSSGTFALSKAASEQRASPSSLRMHLGERRLSFVVFLQPARSEEVVEKKNLFPRTRGENF